MASGGDATRYGVHLMELLINGLLKQGARRDRLEAKMFGGAKTIATFSNVGEQNAAFAMQFLRDEGIPCRRLQHRRRSRAQGRVLARFGPCAAISP